MLSSSITPYGETGIYLCRPISSPGKGTKSVIGKIQVFASVVSLASSGYREEKMQLGCHLVRSREQWRGSPRVEPPTRERLVEIRTGGGEAGREVME